MDQILLPGAVTEIQAPKFEKLEGLSAELVEPTGHDAGGMAAG